MSFRSFLQGFNIAITGDETTSALCFTHADVRWEVEAAWRACTMLDVRFALPHDAEGHELFSFRITVASPALDSIAVLIAPARVLMIYCGSVSCGAEQVPHSQV